MSIRLSSSLLSPMFGRSRPIYSGQVSFNNPFIVNFNAVPLHRTVIYPIVISPVIYESSPVSIIRSTISNNYCLGYYCDPVIISRATIDPQIEFLTRNSMSIIYGSTIHNVREIRYESEVVLSIRNVVWCSEKTSLRNINYQQETLVYNTKDVTWSSISSGSIYSTINITYSSVGIESVYSTREILWSSIGTESVLSIRNISWSSVNYTTIFITRGFQWGSIGTTSVSSIRNATWFSSDDIYSNRSLTYKSIVVANKVRQNLWESVDPQHVYSIRNNTYRSFVMDTQFVIGNAYILPDIPLTLANITADEESPYYQCEVELLYPSDYYKLPRNTPFILRLFSTDYHFVVDSRSFNRSIDDHGNLIETATISGLSPLCLKSSSRATNITKIWTSPTYASSIVTELLGTVTWNLVDWMIPAYRLSVNNVNLLTVAQQIVNAAGGLIESQPDGSIIVRHRWPVSIDDLETASTDHTLYETDVYSLKESPTNDELIDSIHILDTQAGYQDRLEYIPNKIGDETDPFNGILYAYPSPWRDDLSIVTTRGSMIQLGILSTGVKTIAGNDAETITFSNGQSSTEYPIMSLTSLDWLDDDLGSLSYTPYATTLECSNRGSYQGHSLCKVEYTSGYLSVPVTCLNRTEITEAQFLLVENSDG